MDKFGRFNKDAFTLIEALVSLVVLAVCVTALLQLQLGSIRLCRRASMQDSAALLAAARLSEILASAEPESLGGEGECEPDAQFRWKASISETPVAALEAESIGPVRIVSVSVTWVEGAEAKSVELTSYMPKVEAR